MYSNFRIKQLIKSAHTWLRPEIHPVSLQRLGLRSPLPRCLLELSLESDLYYLSLTLSPRLCLFLRLSGDLDKRVWAAREQPVNTKRTGREEREEEAESRGIWYPEPFAPCSSHCCGLRDSLLFTKTDVADSRGPFRCHLHPSWRPPGAEMFDLLCGGQLLV